MSEKKKQDISIESKKKKRIENIRNALAQFGFTKFRGLQGNVIRNVLKKKDSLVLMPTGGGKSLCYQLPSLLFPGIVIVVSPLLALMQDQVQALKSKQIQVELICSLINDKAKKQIFQCLITQATLQNQGKQVKDRIKLIYTTPETLLTSSFHDIVKELHKMKYFSLLAIDEAHCICSWGHDFRPAYRKLGVFRKEFPDVPCIALTATATRKVRQDIKEQLHLDIEGEGFIADFNRSNIHYCVQNKDSLSNPIGALKRFIIRRHKNKTGIVYVHKRDDVDVLVEECQKDFACAAFHAKISVTTRQKTLESWLQGKIKVIFATIAFGMGIDHPNVRFVVHWNMPKSLEGFYQESGRAGRDGQQAESVLFFSEEDHRLFRFLAEKKNKYENAALKANAIQLLEEVVQFATRKQCRRQQILGYFGQQFFSSQCAGTCDVCDKSLQFFRSEPIGFVLSQTQAKSTCTNTRSVSTHPLKNSLRRSYDLIGTKYQPSETVTLVVDEHKKKKVLAGEGFVAVNGSSDNGTYDAYMSSKKFFVGHKRGRENIDSTLDALERAEKREQEQSIRISSSKSSRSRLADKLL